MAIQAAWHRQALRISGMLTESFYEMRREKPAVAKPKKVIQALN